MAQGLGQMQQGMGQDENGKDGTGKDGEGKEGSSGDEGQGAGGQGGQQGPSNEELMAQLQAEMDGVMKSLRSGRYLAGTDEGSKAASDWGYGTTDLKADSTPGNDSGNRDVRNVEGAGNERSEIDFNALYAPEQTPKESYDTRVHGRMNDSGATLLQEFSSLPTDADGLTSYYNIVEAYTGAQEQAVDNEEIPWEYRELVKIYFNGLNDPKDGILPTVESENTGAEGEEAGGEKVPTTGDGTKIEEKTEEEVDET